MVTMVTQSLATFSLGICCGTGEFLFWALKKGCTTQDAYVACACNNAIITSNRRNPTCLLQGTGL